MKTFRLIGMALAAVMMCVNFTACSSDDDEPEIGESGIVTNQKRLVKIEEKSGDGDFEVGYEFEYDSKGRLSSRTAYKGTYGDKSNFIWEENTITESDEGTQWYTEYTLDNGLVQKSVSGESTYFSVELWSYNPSGQVIEIEEEGTYSSHNLDSYTWEGQKLIKFDDEYYTYTLGYSEGKTCKKGYSPVIADLTSDDDFNLAFIHPELFGGRSTYLPDMITIKGKNGGKAEVQNLSYTLDSEGYVTKIEYKSNYGNSEAKVFIWE